MKQNWFSAGTATAVIAIMAGSVYFAPTVSAEMDAPREQRHVLNLNDVEIAALIEDVSIVTGYTFIVHPQVRGRVTVMSQTPLATDEVFDVFLSTLRVHQFVAVPAGDKTYRIVPEQTAAGSAGIVGRGVNGEEFVTQIIKLDYFNAVEAAQMVKPIINSSGQVVANKNSNTLVVVDYAANLPRIRDVVRQLDEDKTIVQTLALSNVAANEMEAILNGLNDEYSMNFDVVASESTNAVVVRGEDVGVARALEVARKLDSTERIRDNVRVIPLNNAKADEIVPVLEQIGAALAGQATPSEAGSSNNGAPTIAHHEQTNSLVISARYETLNSLERVVNSLDVRRPQVMVEALVVEMSDNAVDELGLQFVVSGTDGEIPFASTNYSRSAPNLLALTGALASPGGLIGDDTSTTNAFQSAAVSSLLGLEGLTFGGGGVSGDTLFGIIVNAVEQDTTSNILSTPLLMALDNETSSITVGQEIPITTGEVLSNNNSNPFRTIERKDVGVQLDVTPQIGEGDTIRLQIYQEASNVAEAIGETSEIITNKREINTTVLADDGEIIVLGGLIEQRKGTASSKVPILGDLPGVGALFRSEGETSVRTNLMVFIRPSIVRDSGDAAETTRQKFNYIRAQEMLRTGRSESSIDSFIRDVLGTVPPGG